MNTDKPLVKRVILLIFIISGINSYSQIVRIYLKNTGNETVYVAYGYHDNSFFSWTNTYRGWYKLEPGQKHYYCSISSGDEASFAFSKRGGSVVYKPKGGSSSRIGVESFYVHPTDTFKYTDTAPKSFTLINTSFKVAQAYCGDCLGQTLYQTIKVPSKTSDVVIPFKKKEKKKLQFAPKFWVSKIQYNRIYEEQNAGKKREQFIFNEKGDVYLYEIYKNELLGFKTEQKKKYSSTGKYTVKGNRLEFSLTSVHNKKIVIKYVGIIKGNIIDLKATNFLGVFSKKIKLKK